jgi:hypothetical protein
MGGKASLVLVLAFGVLFGIVASTILRTSNDATDNFVDYYKQEKAHNIATSALNIAANKIFINHSWNAGLPNLPIAGGVANVTVENFGTYGKMVTSISDFAGYTDTAIAWLEPKNFAQYGNFYDIMGSVWAAAGDTFSGPFHTNDFLQSVGHPVFRGFTTCTKGIKNFDQFSSPELQGGFSLSPNIPLSFDASLIENAAISDGMVFEKNPGNGYINVKLNFNSDGTVTYWQRDGAVGPWGDSTTVALTTLAPNGVLYVKKGDVFIKGTLNGKVTIMANKSGTGGVIHISDDIKYNKNPLIEPSTDMLGLVAQEHVQLDLNPARGDVDIHASIYTQNRGLYVETSNINTFPEFTQAYKMNLLGGVIGKKVDATADYELIGGVWTPVRGYSYVHKFDERFNQEVPPFFPVTVKLRVVNWLE